MGATNVKVMNGGYPKWVAEKRATEEGEGKPGPAEGDFNYALQPHLLAKFEDI